MKSKYTYKGFTLIELLIVIVVIGILAAAMMLSSTEAVTTAKATKIISDLNMLSKAANAWYLDNYKKLVSAGGTNGVNGFKIDGKEFHQYVRDNPDEFTKYMDRSITLNTGKTQYNATYKGNYTNTEFFAPVGGYALYMGHSNIVCYAVYGISATSDASDESRLKQKLKAKAKSAGLQSYGYGKVDNDKSTSTINEYNGRDANVFMTAFTLKDPN